MKIKMAEGFKDVKFIVVAREIETECFVWFLKEWEDFGSANINAEDQLQKVLTMDKAILISAVPTAVRTIFERFGATTELSVFRGFVVIRVDWA